MTAPRAHLLVLANADDDARLGAARRRLTDLPRIYGTPAQSEPLVLSTSSGGGSLLAALHDPAEQAGSDECWSWGRRSTFTHAAAFLAAPAAGLTSLPTPCCVAAIADGRARLASSAGAIQCLYEAAGEGLRVWSTHALAASLVAHGGADADPLSLAELVACDFVGGEATLLRGVRALAPGTWIDVEGRRHRAGAATGRWAPLPADQAAATAERVLVADLAEAVHDAAAPALGLTAGLDSRTVAVALAEAGVALRTATFDPGDRGADVAGARDLAGALGLAHEVAPMQWWTPAGDGHARMLSAAAWHDGQREAGYGAVVWPRGTDRWIAGVGAETGRAFYWRWLAPRRDTASARTLLRTLRLTFEPRLTGADPDRIRALRERWRRWVDDAVATGHTGWNALDIVYADQRVRRWGRAQMPIAAAEWVPAYAGPELLRALASLPLADRLTDGWQRRFLRTRRPDLEPAEPALTRPPRAALAREQLILAARRARRRLAGPAAARSTPEIVWHQLDFWRERAAYVEWLCDAVLDAPIVREALGDGWVAEQRGRFLAGDPRAAQVTRLAAGPFAMLEAVTARSRAAPELAGCRR